MSSPQQKVSVTFFALIVALAAGRLDKPDPALAQTDPPASSIPVPIPSGSTVRIDGSTSMALINQVLEKQVQADNPSLQFTTTYTGTDPSLQALREGKIDLAAIGRPLTATEKAEGLTQVIVRRDKISMIVSPTNSFDGSLTDAQFAKIFRGEIKDWAEVGGSPGAIRLIDRPDDSDTRQALKNYPVFKQAPFVAGLSTFKLNNDLTDSVIKELGSDGIGYAITNQVVNRTDVRIVRMHQTLPPDPRYPFSHPLVYVYKTSTPAVQSFLAYAISNPGQKLLETSAPNVVATPALTDPLPTVTPAATPLLEASPVAVAPVPVATPESGLPDWLWWLLPLGLLGILGFLLKKRPEPLGGTSADPPKPPSSPSPAAPPVAFEPVKIELAKAAFFVDPNQPGKPQLVEPTQPTADPTPPVTPPDPTTPTGSAPVGLIGGALAAAGAVAVAGLLNRDETQTQVEAARFDLGATELTPQALADVDQGLGDLPSGYGDSRILLMPRDPQWAYSYWDTPNDHKERIRQQGGEQLALRLYDVTDRDIESQGYHSLQEYPCDEMAREWYFAIPASDRFYLAEIGYRTADGRWLMLARSAAIMIPPAYASDWIDDHFLTIPFSLGLQGKTVFQLQIPQPSELGSDPKGWGLASLGTQWVAGSMMGSQISSFALPSGAGMLDQAPWLASGSGLGLFSGASEVAPVRSRNFWLIADAELIVYGATDPAATVTMAGRTIPLNPDGTFRFQMAFPDGNLDFPIHAMAVDREQTREIHLTFDRQTLTRRTNPLDQAIDELW